MIGRLFSEAFRALSRARPATSTSPQDNPLAEYFSANPGRIINKWHHYFEIYHRHFATFRDRSPVVLEIGVFHGGSLEMWRHYFGPGTRIVGIDIDPRCSELEDEDITIVVGDQADRLFLARVCERFPHVDIVIDDGGHLMEQQIATFEVLYPHVQPHGVYVCEDMQTSMYPNFGGGFQREGTFLEYSKALVDRLYAWHSKEPERLAVDAVTQSTYALHFYDGVLVVEKRPMAPPRELFSGTRSF
jgi:23S rRNA U2552 (ribose-2'-O)-methylase RlmE/FtsJ